MDTQSLVERLSRDLRGRGNPERATQEKRYLKSDLNFYGCPAPVLREVMVPLKKELRDIAPADLWALVEALWAEPWHEPRAVAIGLLEHFRKRLVAADLARLEPLLRTSYTWAYVDALAVHVAGSLVSRFPELQATMARWATDDDFWIRRSALLALLFDLRTGAGDFALFARLATPMLEEREFFIRKAIGWVLREVSKKRPALVRDFVAQHGARMSGLTRREATKYLPAV